MARGTQCFWLLLRCLFITVHLIPADCILNFIFFVFFVQQFSSVICFLDFFSIGSVGIASITVCKYLDCGVFARPVPVSVKNRQLQKKKKQCHHRQLITRIDQTEIKVNWQMSTWSVCKRPPILKVLIVHTPHITMCLTSMYSQWNHNNNHQVKYTYTYTKCCHIDYFYFHLKGGKLQNFGWIGTRNNLYPISFVIDFYSKNFGKSAG